MPAASLNRILLIDDDEDDCFLFAEALKSSFPEVLLHCAPEFLEASNYLINTKPDLIFLDLNMPYKNGFVVLSELKNDEVFKQIPIIVFSSSDNPREIKQAYEKGAALYITKPIVFKDLLLALRQVLSKDWGKPAIITANYFVDGHYEAFKTETI